MEDSWRPEESAAERARREEAYHRLAEAAKRVGVPLERLAAALRRLERNEVESRRFLAEEVYGVPDSLLDDLVRVRLADLADPPDEGGPDRRG